MIPKGAWGHLDSLFPDQANRDLPNYQSYISRTDTDSFIFGYWSNDTVSRTEWYCVMDLDTGIPIVISFSVWNEGQPWSYFYNVTMTLERFI
jgi:hypothetical protein